MIAVLAAIVVGFRACIAPSVSRDRILTSVVERGSIDASLSASGTVVPEYEQVITCPVSSRVEAVLLHSGDTVLTGQSILQLDTDRAASFVEKLRDELSYLKNQKKQLVLDLERKTIDLEASRDIKDLEVRHAEASLERTRRLHALGGATDETLAADELNLDIAERLLLQVTRSIENQKASLAAEIDGIEFQVQIKAKEIREAERDLERAGVRAERGGVVTWVRDDVGATINAGDAVARVADLTSYKIEAQISEIHASKLSVGGEVVVRIGDVRLAGTVSAVKPGVENGIARFDVTLDDKSNPILRPNLRSDVFVITAFKDDVLRVENGPFYRGKVDQIVFVIDGDKAIGRPVDIGVSNYEFVELKGEISVGDTVIVSDMSEYEHADEVALDD
jgi:HlyD family secretion protein